MRKKHTHLSKAVVLPLSLSFFFRRAKTSLAFKATFSLRAPPVPIIPSLSLSLSYIVALIIASKGPAPLLYLSIDDVPLSFAPSKKFLWTLINLRTQKSEVQKRAGREAPIFIAIMRKETILCPLSPPMSLVPRHAAPPRVSLPTKY